MPREGFEPTVTASAQEKTIHALDRSATVTGPSTVIIKKKADSIIHYQE
jgi:hypothetical protein